MQLATCLYDCLIFVQPRGVLWSNLRGTDDSGRGHFSVCLLLDIPPLDSVWPDHAAEYELVE